MIGLILEKIIVVWKFSRPHTLLGTSFSIIGIFLLVISSIYDFFSPKIIYLFLVLLVTLLANLYITGLNQITDIEIDRINKPFLPLASNELSVNHAKIIIMVALIFSILFSLILDYYLFLTVIISIIIGTLYSLEPIRFKKIPIFASLSIISVRGFIVNIGIFFSFRNLLKYSIELNNQISFLTIFISMLSISIALMKDIPDLIGDKTFKISTLPIIFGRKLIYFTAILIIFIIYLITIFSSFFLISILEIAILGLIHIVILSYIVFRVNKTDYNSDVSISSLYYFIWKLFYLEYIIIPLIFISF